MDFKLLLTVFLSSKEDCVELDISSVDDDDIVEALNDHYETEDRDYDFGIDTIETECGFEFEVDVKTDLSDLESLIESLDDGFDHDVLTAVLENLHHDYSGAESTFRNGVSVYSDKSECCEAMYSALSDIPSSITTHIDYDGLFHDLESEGTYLELSDGRIVSYS